jgi:hypothetical protein
MFASNKKKNDDQTSLLNTQEQAQIQRSIDQAIERYQQKKQAAATSRDRAKAEDDALFDLFLFFTREIDQHKKLSDKEKYDVFLRFEHAVGSPFATVRAKFDPYAKGGYYDSH